MCLRLKIGFKRMSIEALGIGQLDTRLDKICHGIYSTFIYDALL